MTHGITGEWRAMVQRFDDLGRAADAALEHDAAEVARLLEERDALLDELTTALAAPRSDTGAITEALGQATESTTTLIMKVAERTDALRRALREVDRGARATNAYQHAHGGAGFLDARR
jgi:ABC-type transporter Mla subunit MlaD